MGKSKYSKIVIDSSFFERSVEKLINASGKKTMVEVWIGNLGNEAVKALVKTMSKNKKLSCLNVRAYKNYPVEEMILFFVTLAQFQVKHLQTIRIHAPFKDGVLAAAKKYFQINNSVQQLQIDDINNGHSIFTSMKFVKNINLKDSGPVSASTISSLQHLIQNGCNWLQLVLKDVSATNQFCEALRHSSSLSILRIHLPPTLHDESTFIEALSTVSSLKTLTFLMSSINRTVRKDFFTGISTLTSLEHLQVRLSLTELEALSPIIQTLKSFSWNIRRWRQNLDDQDPTEVGRIIGTVFGASPLAILKITCNATKIPEWTSKILNVLPPGLTQLVMDIPLNKLERRQLAAVVRSRRELKKITLHADEPPKFRKELEYFIAQHRLLDPLLREGNVGYYPLALAKLSRKKPTAVYYLLSQNCGELFSNVQASTTSNSTASSPDTSLATESTQDGSDEIDEVNSAVSGDSTGKELWLENNVRTTPGLLVWKDDLTNSDGKETSDNTCNGGKCHCSIM